MVYNLEELFEESKDEISKYTNRELILSTEFKKEFIKLKRFKEVEFLKYTASLETSPGSKVYFPNQWFVLANISKKYIKELIKYKQVCNTVFQSILLEEKTKGISDESEKEKIKVTKSEIEEYYKKFKLEYGKLTTDKTKEDYIRNTVGSLIDEDLNHILSIYEGIDSTNIDDVSYSIKKFLCDYSYWKGEKDINRDDFYASVIPKLIGLQNNSSALVYTLVGVFVNEEKLANLLETTSIYSLAEVKSKLDFMHNRIIFGAPGTGKSYKLNLDVDKFDEYERVTFYSKYNYNNFVGAYKPVTKIIDNEERVTYEYVPGPFIRSFIKAVKNPDKNYLLIIEEINRANPAAVFGDLFQLLDRDKEGISTYPINISEELKGFFRKEDNLGVNIEEITLPGNLFIWATMNSADQGIYPMDSAFKRRWSFEYIGVDDNQDKLISKSYNRIKLKSGPNNGDYEEYSWNEIRREINKILLKENVLEDKLIGPFFLDEKELTLPQEQFDELFKGKVLMYLFEDVLKHKNSSLFTVKKKSFSEIAKSYKDGTFFTFNLDDCKNDRV